MTIHSELDGTPLWADGGDHETREQLDGVGFDLAGDDYDGDYDDDHPADEYYDYDYYNYDYCAGWQNGYDYATNNWLLWLTPRAFLAGVAYWLRWRRRTLKWKALDLRRELLHCRPSDSDIPF